MKKYHRTMKIIHIRQFRRSIYFVDFKSYICYAFYLLSSIRGNRAEYSGAKSYISGRIKITNLEARVLKCSL